MNSKEQSVITIFDLDGVIVDNIAFEIAVTDCIVGELARKRGVSTSEAKTIWDEQLRLTRGNVRWFDYGFHCACLDLGDAYREAHWASSFALNICDGVEDVVSVARQYGDCWIATDASEWVAKFKLQALYVPDTIFSEIFDSTRCLSHKGMSEYWEIIRESLKARNARAVFIDNRLDRVEAAMRIVPELSCLLVEGRDQTPGSLFPVTSRDSMKKKLTQLLEGMTRRGFEPEN